MSLNEGVKPLEIPLQDLLSATNSFAKENRIGSGGFGTVYKGESVKYGTIAIKRLDLDRSEHGQGDFEFKREIALLSIYKHENIVTLVGFCNEDGEKILVYKYESNQSLDKHLRRMVLSWTQRLRICLGAALGLKYLHHDVPPEHRIIHRDVKSANILLDENLNAKISDFGLCKEGLGQHSFVISNACGTPGYIDPDYVHIGHLTQKSDVFSFGIVLFEVLCGRRAFLRVDGQYFYVWVQKHYKRQTLDKIIHAGLHGKINTTSLATFSAIAYQCLSNGEERPTMKEIVEQLQKALDDQLLHTQQVPSGSLYNDDVRIRLSVGMMKQLWEGYKEAVHQIVNVIFDDPGVKELLDKLYHEEWSEGLVTEYLMATLCDYFTDVKMYNVEERSFRGFVECCLEQTVIIYVDHLMSQKSYIKEETIERMRLDEEVLMDFFREYISVNKVEKRARILIDLRELASADSPDTITLVYTRILQHQPDCPPDVVEKLVGLREGIPRKDAKEVVEECKEIYENSLIDGNPPRAGFVFSKLKSINTSKITIHHQPFPKAAFILILRLNCSLLNPHFICVYSYAHPFKTYAISLSLSLSLSLYIYIYTHILVRYPRDAAVRCVGSNNLQCDTRFLLVYHDKSTCITNMYPLREYV